MESVIKNDQSKDQNGMPKSWNNKPIYLIHLSDGRGGESFTQIPIGTPVSDLEITPNPPYSDRIKLKKQGGSFSGGGFKQRSGNESFSLSYAKDLAVAYVTKGTNVEPEKILLWADKFYEWLEKKKAVSLQQSESKQANPVQSNSDLPF